MAVRGVPPLRVVHSPLFNGGVYSTPVGTTKNKAALANIPVRRRVVLLDAINHQAIRETWSDAVTGEWQFIDIRAGVYRIIAIDHTREHGPLCAGPFTIPVPETP